MEITGSVSARSTRRPVPLVPNQYSQQIHRTGAFINDSRTPFRAGSEISTEPPFPRSEEFTSSGPTPLKLDVSQSEDRKSSLSAWSAAGSPDAEENENDENCKLRGTGAWMSSMFLGSIHMHNDQQTITTEVRRGTSGRAKPWLTFQDGNHIHPSKSQKQTTTPKRVMGFRSIDNVRATVPLAMMRNPAVKFDRREVHAPTESLSGAFEAEDLADGVLIRHPRRSLQVE